MARRRPRVHTRSCPSHPTIARSARRAVSPSSSPTFERLGDDAERLTSFIENRAFMRMHDGHCAALELDTDVRRWRCTIYERRPETCRHLERGSPECAGERWAKAERPLIELRRIGGG